MLLLALAQTTPSAAQITAGADVGLRDLLQLEKSLSKLRVVLVVGLGISLPTEVHHRTTETPPESSVPRSRRSPLGSSDGSWCSEAGRGEFRSTNHRQPTSVGRAPPRNHSLLQQRARSRRVINVKVETVVVLRPRYVKVLPREARQVRGMFPNDGWDSRPN